MNLSKEQQRKKRHNKTEKYDTHSANAADFAKKGSNNTRKKNDISLAANANLIGIVLKAVQ